ncbi:MAG: acid--CoA ligase [Phenylobacterium sp.]|nr:acid--CoA ligase [Phenylobacterium sp.]
MGTLPGLHAARDPDAPAITCEGKTLTRAQFAARVNRRARGLAAHGVREGDFVAIALPNGPAFLELAFAAWTLGATPAPVSYRLPAPELKAIIELMQPRVVIGGEATRAAGVDFLDEATTHDEATSADPLPELTAKHVKAIASGGSTGRPKVIVDHAPSIIDPDAASLGMQLGDTVIIPGPLYHAAPFGLAYMALCWGCHLVVTKRFEPSETLRLIGEHKVQWAYLVPTMMHRIWRLPDAERAAADVSSLEMIVHIASACPVWLKEKWIEWLGPDAVWEVYSGTEAMGGTSIGGREWLTHKGSVGRLMPGSEIRILREDGTQAPAGEVGEVFFLPAGGRGATYHYIGAEPRAKGEWETFGDMGHIDEEGYLYLADRRTDLIISGGANIYPAEVEAAVDAYPGVLSSVVVGLPHDDLGQAVHAILEMAPGGPPLDEAQVKAFLAERIAPYKIPRSLEVTHERLRDDAGKVRRSALRDQRAKTEA